MFGLKRILITAAVALWLPLCCCQVLAFANAATGVESASCCEADEQANEKTSDKHTHSCCEDEETPSHEQAPKSCVHCATKAPPPTAPSLDSLFILTEIAFDGALPLALIEPSLLHANELYGRWAVPPPPVQLGCVMSASERRSTFSIWII